MRFLVSLTEKNGAQCAPLHGVAGQILRLRGRTEVHPKQAVQRGQIHQQIAPAVGFARFAAKKAGKLRRKSGYDIFFSRKLAIETGICYHTIHRAQLNSALLRSKLRKCPAPRKGTNTGGRSAGVRGRGL